MIIKRHETEYFGIKVVVKKIKTPFSHPYPWVFKIIENGNTHTYAGIPNRCHSKASALRRAWWRCKWMSEGVYREKYK